MTTPNRHIPYVPQGTLDPAAGLNTALNFIDALLQTAVISMTDTTPPVSPSDGDLYIVGAGATGAWADQDNNLARYVEEGNSWQFFEAGTEVFLVFNRADGALYRYDSGWGLAAFAPYVPVQDVSDEVTTATPTNYNRYMRMSHASAVLEFKSGVSYLLGAEYHVRYVGSGSLTITGDSGFTINAPTGGTLQVPPGGTATIKIVGEDEADLIGVTVEAAES